MIDRIFRIEYRGEPHLAVERGGTVRLAEGYPFGELHLGPEIANNGGPNFAPAFRLLAPVEPSKIVGVGLNYKSHAAEVDKPLPAEPLIFIKPSTAVIGPAYPIRIPAGVGRVDHVAELGVVIRRRAFHVLREEALEYVLGYTCVNDVTARDLQNRGIQYSHCKGFDTFAPVGPCIAVGLDPAEMTVEGWVNGRCRQTSTTREMIFSVQELVAYNSSVMTLLPGDIISTGTPAGIGPLTDGDDVVVKIEGVGELSNQVERFEGAAVL